ncbi:SGNH hydrolase-type esterase domain-containing protein [Armillaria novae-zelandiae]|uniref:SGNH hydrolase-type esterase domain-containing protein n=1 Tax=Armillaria novae-zelandiae TaxID=153914 RepID=A0AA39NNF1_9AGAR|nr:SGNH hydrolase-type esterase domain-containing protein [Armillaria novae-zelandiae]KAK0468879.1 SGNH hydrolase-type esterase domain-containing protein [Armillaria novae-zelandiae]
MFKFPQVYLLLLAVGANAQKYWFSFGDSYTQTGFTTTGTRPAVGNPLGNPPYPGWTSSGGQNWVDYATAVDNTSLVLTYNLAYGGATISADLVAPFDPTVLSLTDQVNQFLDNYASKPSTTPWTSVDTLFSVWIGINDIGNSYYLGGDRDAFSDTLLDAYFALIQQLYNVGARNFLFLNVPPIDRSPLMLAQSDWSQTTEKSVIEGFNTKLTARAASLKANHSGVTTWIWDSNAAFTTILDSPTTYGFDDATTFGDSPGLFWINNLHPTSPAHEYFGKDVADALGGFI